MMTYGKILQTFLAGALLLVWGCAGRDVMTAAGPTSFGKEASRLSPGQVEYDHSADLGEDSDLSDYLAYAALRNPGLQAAFERWRAAVERIPQAGSLPDPRFSYRYFIEEVETRVGAQRQAFELAQTFPWFGKLEAAGDAASQAARVEQQRYEAAKLRLFFEVKAAYYEYYYLARAVATARENVTLMTHLETVARTRYKGSAGGHPDVIRAQVELGKLDDRLQSLLDMRGPVTAELNAALNRPTGAALPWPGEITSETVTVDEEQLRAWLVESNPELRALASAVKQREQQIELAEKQYYPDITVGASFVDVSDSTGGRDPDDDGKDAVAGMVSVNVPIWHHKYAAAVREARGRHHAALLDEQDRTNTLNRELTMVLYRLRDAQRKVDLYGGSLLPKAKESLKVTEAAFRTGASGFSDLIDAQQLYLEFALAWERARVDREQSVAKLEMMVGREITVAPAAPQ